MHQSQCGMAVRTKQSLYQILYGHQGEGTTEHVIEKIMIITDQFWECCSPCWPC